MAILTATYMDLLDYVQSFEDKETNNLLENLPRYFHSGRFTYGDNIC